MRGEIRKRCSGGLSDGWKLWSARTRNGTDSGHYQTTLSAYRSQQPIFSRVSISRKLNHLFPLYLENVYALCYSIKCEPSARKLPRRTTRKQRTKSVNHFLRPRLNPFVSSLGDADVTLLCTKFRLINDHKWCLNIFYLSSIGSMMIQIFILNKLRR